MISLLSQILLSSKFNEFSDHAPVFFTLQSKSFQPKQARPEIHEKQSASPLRFDSDKVPLFRTYLLNNNDVLTGLIEQVNTGSIDGIIKDFTTFMYDNGEQAFGVKKQYHVNTKENLKHSEWFNYNCQKVRQDFKTARNIFSRDRNEENRKIFVKTRTKYNRRKRQANNKFKRSEGKNVCNLAKSNLKKFWKAIKNGIRKISPCLIT